MQIINNPLNPAQIQSGQSAQNKSARDDQRKEAEERSEPVNAIVPVQELIRAGEVRQVERIQSSSQLENLPLQSRQALSEYQNTQDASREYEGGVLVGIDIFV